MNIVIESRPWETIELFLTRWEKNKSEICKICEKYPEREVCLTTTTIPCFFFGTEIGCEIDKKISQKKR